MLKTSYQRTVMLFFVILLMATSACVPSSPLTAKSSLTVMGTLADAGQSSVEEARIILSRSKHVVETTVPVLQNEFQGTLAVPIGEWELTVLLIDAAGTVKFQSKPETVLISLDKPTIIELTLRPADSTVHISIMLDQYMFANEALRARIHFDDTIYEVIRDDASIPLEATLSISPGSYEFKIELYTESFRAGDRLGLGAWEVLHISEKEEIFITWSPDTNSLQLSGRVETILPAPKNLLTERTEGGVLVTWDAVPHWEVAGYFLFAQETSLERFTLLNSTPLEELSFLHLLDPEDTPTQISYVVAAVSTSGMIGYYSQPETWHP